MSINPSTLVSAETKADVTDLWDMAAAFPANWASAIILRTAFTTDVRASQTESEQRRGHLGKPYRTIEALLRGYNSDETAALWDSALRAASARSLLPLYCDQTRSTGPSSGATVPCPPQHRRFFKNARILLLHPHDGSFDVRAISEVGSSFIELSSNPSKVFPSDTLVLPLIEARVAFQSGLRVLSSRFVETNVVGVELPSPSSLDLTCPANTIPAEFASYLGYPILSIPPNFADPITGQVSRAGGYSASGITETPVSYGDRPRVNLTLPFLFGRRAMAWPLIRLFESRLGRAFPLWIPSPVTTITLLSYTGTGLRVKSYGPQIDWTLRPFVFQRQANGQVFVRRVVSYSRLGSQDTLVLDAAFPSTSTDVQIGVAYLSRFSSDELMEEWHTDEVVKVQGQFTELLDERSITIPNVPENPTDPIPAIFSATQSGAGEAGETVAMYFLPCRAKGVRPLIRAADLTLPSSIQVTFKPGEFTVDSAFAVTSGSVSSQAIAALTGGPFLCAEIGTSSGEVNRHWHQTRLHDFGASVGWVHDGDAHTVIRTLYRASREYVGADTDTHTIIVDVVVEQAMGDGGLRGAVIHGYAFCDEVNAAYSDGDGWPAADGLTFTIYDPAVWKGISGSSADFPFRHCHPQMLTAFGVPTSWESPCGFLPYSCDDPIYTAGFGETCKHILPAVPWIPGGATRPLSSVIQNVVYQEAGSDRWNAVMLGGDCPTSELMPFVFVENGGGRALTALKPLRNGLDANDILNVLEGSSIDIDFCEPTQVANAISCCDGNPDERYASNGGTPECWKAPSGDQKACSGASTKRCCFRHDSVAVVTFHAKCFCTRNKEGDEVFGGCFSEEHCYSDPPVYNHSVCGSRTMTFTLPICMMDFRPADPTEQTVKWQAYFPTGLQVPYALDDDFDDKDFFTWDTIGSWGSLTSGTATTTGVGGSGNIKALAAAASLSGSSARFSHTNGKVSVKVLSETAAGVAGRIDIDLGTQVDGYGALASVSGGFLQIWHFDSLANTVTKIAELAGLTFTAPYTLSLEMQGERLLAQIEDGDDRFPLATTHCAVQHEGMFAMWGEDEEVEFDDFSFIGSPQLAPVTIEWGPNIRKVTIPKTIVGEGQTWCQSDANGCGEFDVAIGGYRCNCTTTSRKQFPDQLTIEEAPTGFSRFSTPGGPKPYTGDGGGPGVNAAVGTCVAPGDATTPTPDWVVCTVRISTGCNDPCPEGETSNCVGWDVWGGGSITASVPPT